MFNGSLPIIVARYRAKLKSVVGQIKSDVYVSEFERQEQERLRQDFRLLRSRKEDAEVPSPLALDLQKRLIEAERGVAANDGEALGPVDTSVVDIEDEENEIEGDWEGGNSESEEKITRMRRTKVGVKIISRWEMMGESSMMMPRTRILEL